MRDRKPDNTVKGELWRPSIGALLMSSIRQTRTDSRVKCEIEERRVGIESA